MLWGLAPPAILLALLIGALAYALYTRVELANEAEKDTLREWLDEARVHRKTLPELVREYLELVGDDPAHPAADAELLRIRAEEIQAHLAALGNPTKMLPEQLPLFPVIYELRVSFAGTEAGESRRTEPPPTEGGHAEGRSGLRPANQALAPIVWDSGLPRPRPVKEIGMLEHRLLGASDGRATVQVLYQLHAYNKRQEAEATRQQVLRWLVGLAVGAVLVSTLWASFYLRRERARELGRLLAQHQIEHAEKLLLENELHRQEAERKHEEMERRLLEQRLATQAVEQRALEIKSQLFAGIGIMAGSYAHNIKNLLVRPNDLVRRCLDHDELGADQRRMIEEVGQTLHTVTERLQLILKTVRRDPTKAELTRLDLNELLREIGKSWSDIAEQKWKLDLQLELCPEPLWIKGDPSHLTQAIENLVFNARDATFEMRNHLREQARLDPQLSDEARRQRLIAAAAWKGQIVIRTQRHDDAAAVEVRDNGIGMTEEVKRRCTETHFSTKRDNALYQGNTTGMGLGLSFVQAILEGHRGRLEIESEPLHGAVLRVVMPLDACYD
jgi:signal transduction histidine kinase